jgi:hypothetical protein
MRRTLIAVVTVALFVGAFAQPAPAIINGKLAATAAARSWATASCSA